MRLAIRKDAEAAATDAQGRTARALAEELGWAEGARLLAEPSQLPRDNRSSRFALDANREPVRRPELADVPRSVQNQATGASHFQLKVLRELVESDPRLIFSISTDDELAHWLLEHDADPEAIGYFFERAGQTPLQIATAGGKTRVAALLKDAGARR